MEYRDVAKSEAYEKGQKVRREMMGDELVDKLANTVYADPVMEKFGDYATEAVFGLLWTRPGLDRKTRAMICVISDTVHLDGLSITVKCSPQIPDSRRQRASIKPRRRMDAGAAVGESVHTVEVL